MSFGLRVYLSCVCSQCEISIRQKWVYDDEMPNWFFSLFGGGVVIIRSTFPLHVQGLFKNNRKFCITLQRSELVTCVGSTAFLISSQYFPDLPPCDFSGNFKLVLKRRRFDTTDGTKTNSAKVLQHISEQAFLDCFVKWRHRWEKCTTRTNKLWIEY